MSTLSDAILEWYNPALEAAPQTRRDELLATLAAHRWFGAVPYTIPLAVGPLAHRWHRVHIKQTQDPDELLTWISQPAWPLTVYRGCQKDKSPHRSWAIERHIAERYTRWHNVPDVITTTLQPEEVVGVIVAIEPAGPWAEVITDAR